MTTFDYFPGFTDGGLSPNAWWLSPLFDQTLLDAAKALADAAGLVADVCYLQQSYCHCQNHDAIKWPQGSGWCPKCRSQQLATQLPTARSRCCGVSTGKEQLTVGVGAPVALAIDGKL